MKIGGKKVKICCMNLEIAVRVIGCLGFFAALVLILQLSTELWEHDGDSRIAAMLDPTDETDPTDPTDLDGDETSTPHNSYRNVRFLVGLMSFSCFYLISSALLIYSSIVKSRAFTVPWLLCELFGFATQVTGLVYYTERHNAAPSAWLLIVTIFSLVLTLYFWVTVVCAQFEWRVETRGELVVSPSSFRVGFDNAGFDNANSVKISKLPV